MLPILISESLAPGSYFFWAKALVQLAVSKASAVATDPNRQQLGVIPKFRVTRRFRAKWVPVRSKTRQDKRPLLH